jgi:hypothetical protein
LHLQGQPLQRVMLASFASGVIAQHGVGMLRPMRGLIRSRGAR